jgi:hypothetical protein
MTFGGEASMGETYLGFDFGTSNSSLSLVRSEDIRAFEDRASDRNWLSMNELVSALPYPVAAPLACFIAEVDPERLERHGREALEMMLTLAAYVSYLESCALRRKESKTALFKGFQHRSAGPLLSLLRQSLAALDGKGMFSVGLSKLNQERLISELNRAVSDIALAKHGKRASIDYPRLIASLGNCLYETFSDCMIGYFHDVKQKRFSKEFQGVFRATRGSNRPFVDLYVYAGEYAFSSESVYVVNLSAGTALNLSPLVFWDLDGKGESGGEPDMFFYDTSREKQQSYGYKAVMLRDELRIEGSGDLRDVVQELQRMREDDPHVSILEHVHLVPTWEREA